MMAVVWVEGGWGNVQLVLGGEERVCGREERRFRDGMNAKIR